MTPLYYHETVELMRFLTGREYCRAAQIEVEAGRATPENVFVPLFEKYEQVNVLDTVRARMLHSVSCSPLPFHHIAEYELISHLMYDMLINRYPFPSLEQYH